MRNEKLIRHAFHLRQSIDALEDGQQKQRLAKKYAKIIWRIQDYETSKHHKMTEQLHNGKRV